MFRRLSPIKFESTNQILEFAQFCQKLLKQNENTVTDLNKLFVVAQNGFTYLLDDVFYAELVPSDHDLLFLCRVNNENAKKMSVIEIRELYCAQLYFTNNFALAQCLQSINEDKNLDEIDGINCQIDQEKLLNPYITPEGHTYGPNILSWLLKNNTDPKASSGGRLTSFQSKSTDGSSAIITITKPLTAGHLLVNKSLKSLILTLERDKISKKELVERQEYYEALQQGIKQMLGPTQKTIDDIKSGRITVRTQKEIDQLGLQLRDADARAEQLHQYFSRFNLFYALSSGNPFISFATGMCIAGANYVLFRLLSASDMPEISSVVTHILMIYGACMLIVSQIEMMQATKCISLNAKINRSISTEKAEDANIIANLLNEHYNELANLIAEVKSYQIPENYSRIAFLLTSRRERAQEAANSAAVENDNSDENNNSERAPEYAFDTGM